MGSYQQVVFFDLWYDIIVALKSEGNMKNNIRALGFHIAIDGVWSEIQKVEDYN